MRRDDAGASRGGNRLHAATVFDTQDATGLVWTRRINERLKVRLFLVAVRDGDHGILGSRVGSGGRCMRWFLGGHLIERKGKGRGGDGC